MTYQVAVPTLPINPCFAVSQATLDGVICDISEFQDWRFDPDPDLDPDFVSPDSELVKIRLNVKMMVAEEDGVLNVVLVNSSKDDIAKKLASSLTDSQLEFFKVLVIHILLCFCLVLKPSCCQGFCDRGKGRIC